MNRYTWATKQKAACKYFFVLFMLLLIAGTPVAIFCDFRLKHADRAADILLDQCNTKQIDVLYFGDSTIRFTGARDTNKSGIDIMLQRITGKTICSIAEPGYSPVMYNEYIKLLKQTRYRPKLVIAPINLRSFTGTTDLRPALEFPLKKIYIHYLLTGRFQIIEYIKYRFLSRDKKKHQAWEQKLIIYDQFNLGTQHDILERSQISEDLDYNQIREALYTEQLKTKFIYHYMAPVTEHDTMFIYLDTMIQELKELNIPILFYITPINYQDGIKYVGSAFTRRSGKTVSIIEEFMTRRNVSCINLAYTLQPAFFIHKRDVYEHLTDTGRNSVAQCIQKAISSTR